MAMSDDVVRELIQQLKTDQEELKRQLQADRDAHLVALNRINETLNRAFVHGQVPVAPNASSSIQSAPSVVTVPNSLGSPVVGPTRGGRRATGSFSLTPDENNPQPRSIFSGISGVTGGTGDSDSDSGDDESFFVQETIPTEALDHEGLRLHTRQHEWDEHGQRVLGHIHGNKSFLEQSDLFQQEKVAGKDNESGSSGNIYDVGTDGSALLSRSDSNAVSYAIWEILSKINAEAEKRQAVGRIVILREPSSLLFAATHYTMHQYFDMDGIFKLLSDPSPTKAYMRGCFKQDPRRQRTSHHQVSFYNDHFRPAYYCSTTITNHE